MAKRQVLLRRVARIALAFGGLALLAGCQENARLDHSMEAIPADTMALMQEKGVSVDAPLLIRSYKKESELEVWKLKPDGRYIHVKTFPMCRWSGQLGPKMREGDRQAPEGFYTITPGQMNPNSNYYLSFNVGYPNAYDRAHGASGGHIMVHGICSSSGCFSMTNAQMGEIYAIVREAFNGGQHAIQMQSMPFRMTARNLAKHRFDPNMAFWRNLKQGVDNFEVTKQEPIVGVCAKRYVFNATPANGGHFDANAACPPLREDAGVKADVAAKEKRDEAQMAAVVDKGERAVRLVYADGGQNPVFYGKFADTSRPDGLIAGPTELAMDEPPVGKRSKASTMMAKNEAPRSKAEPSRIAAAPVDPQPTATVVAAAPAPAAGETPLYRRLMGYTANIVPKGDAQAAVTDATATPPAGTGVKSEAQKTEAPEAPMYQRLLGMGSDEAKPVTAAPADPAAAQPEMAAPAGHHAAAGTAKPQADARRKPHRDDVARIIDGDVAPIGHDYVALAPSASRH